MSDPRDGMEPIPDWVDDGSVYIDGRLTRNQARHHFDGWYKYVTAHRVYMRKMVGTEALEKTDGEMDEFFSVCSKETSGSFSMWKVWEK